MAEPRTPTPFKIQWKNFHGFENTGCVEFRPLTLLIGPNNSGKSSLIKPLLIMKQTVKTTRPMPALVTRGDLVNAGEFTDFVTKGNLERWVEFGLHFHTHPGKGRRDLKHVGHYPPGSVVVAFGSDAMHGMSVRRFDVSDIYGRRMYRREQRDNGSYSLVGLPVRTKKGGAASAVDAAVRSLIRLARPEHFLFVGAPLFSEALMGVSHDRLDAEADEVELSEHSTEYLRITDHAYSAIRGLLSSLRYLGPLRDEPKRLYHLSGEPPPDVGTRGQFAPELLFRSDDEEFTEGLRHWLAHFEVPSHIVRRDLTEGAFSLGFRETSRGTAVNYADLGFGISQLLPILVQALLTRKKEFLLTEQPEIHLNPRLQAGLADLLASVIARGGGAIVETHSEHLLTRIRRLVASGKIPSQKVAIYFVEKDAKGLSHLREVPIRGNGHIAPEVWPEGFFADALRESVALAAAQRQR